MEISLRQALAATLTHHPAISGKRAEVEAKKYASDSARAQRYPTLSLQAGIQKSDTSENTPPDQKNINVPTKTTRMGIRSH